MVLVSPRGQRWAFRLNRGAWIRREAAAAGVPLTTRIGPGDHEWSYWDAQIQDVLDWLPLRTHAQT